MTSAGFRGAQAACDLQDGGAPQAGAGCGARMTEPAAETGVAAGHIGRSGRWRVRRVADSHGRSKRAAVPDTQSVGLADFWR